MVTDTLDNLEKYAALNPLFPEVVKFIKEHDLLALEPGRHYIKGNDLFVNIDIAKGKTEEEATFETHKRMLDIQIPLSQEEGYGYMPLKDLPEAEYNAEKDATKYKGVKARSVIHCKPGEFAIFWPQDGHQPCIGQGEIKKAIFKVKA